MQSHQLFTYTASFLGFSAIVLGAISAHTLKLGNASHSFDIATKYQLIHALLLLFFAHQLKNQPSKTALVGACLILSGCLFFCLGIYLKAFTGNALWIEAAPLGGVSFMLAWLCIRP
jgi:uncharacterized membrane protein YgdD (TMEM256/DUF423 family)